MPDMKIKMTKESKQILCELGYYFINNKEFDKALAIFNSLILIDDQLPFRYGLANLFFSKADYDKSMEVCRDILEEYPEDSTAMILMAENLIFGNNTAKAQEYLDRVLESDIDAAGRALAQDLMSSIKQGIEDYTKKQI